MKVDITLRKSHFAKRDVFFAAGFSYSLTLVAVFELFSGRCVFFRERTMPTMALRAVGALLQLRERITVHSRAPRLDPSIEGPGVRSDTSKLENCGGRKCALSGRSAEKKK